jgi:hypothetical protein
MCDDGLCNNRDTSESSDGTRVCLFRQDMHRTRVGSYPTMFERFTSTAGSGQPQIGGISITQHEVTVVELYELDVQRPETTIKDQYTTTADDEVLEADLGKHDGPFSYVCD